MISTTGASNIIADSTAAATAIVTAVVTLLSLSPPLPPPLSSQPPCLVSRAGTVGHARSTLRRVSR